MANVDPTALPIRAVVTNQHEVATAGGFKSYVARSGLDSALIDHAQPIATARVTHEQLRNTFPSRIAPCDQSRIVRRTKKIPDDTGTVLKPALVKNNQGIGRTAGTHNERVAGIGEDAVHDLREKAFSANRLPYGQKEPCGSHNREPWFQNGCRSKQCKLSTPGRGLRR